MNDINFEKLKSIYCAHFRELRRNSLVEANSKSDELLSSYLNLIYNKLIVDELFLQPEVTTITVPIGKCETPMCSGLKDKIIDSKLKDVLGNGYTVKRIVHEKIGRGEDLIKLKGLLGFPVNLNKNYTFDYEIKWDNDE